MLHPLLLRAALTIVEVKDTADASSLHLIWQQTPISDSNSGYYRSEWLSSSGEKKECLWWWNTSVNTEDLKQMQDPSSTHGALLVVKTVPTTIESDNPNKK